MIYDKAYSIPFMGLKEGVHHFHFHINADFFKELEYSPIKESDIDVDLNFHKHDNFFDLQFDLNGSVRVPCDRCLEKFDFPIDNHFQLIVKFNPNPDSTQPQDDDEIKYIEPNATEINVAQPIYEYINLSLPMQKVHPNNSCSNEVSELIEEHSPDKEDEDKIDPRWEKLKEIKKKNYGST